MLEKSPISSYESESTQKSGTLNHSVKIEAKSADQVKPDQSIDQKLPLLLANADVLIKNQEHHLAFHLVLEALKINSHHPFAIKLLLKLKKGNLESTNRLYQNLLKVDYSFENLIEWGHFLYQHQMDSEAQEKYESALSMIFEPNMEMFEIYKNLGNIYLKQGDFDAAEEMYNKAFVINPTSATLNVNIGTLEISKNLLDDAQTRFRMVLESKIHSDKAWVGLALVHQQKGDLILAQANLENALEIHPTNKTAVHLLSNIYINSGQLQKASDLLQRFLDLNGHDEDMSLVLIHVFIMMQRLSEALIEVEKFLLWNPHHDEVIKIETQLKELKIEQNRI